MPRPRHERRCNGPGITVYELKRRLRHEFHGRCIREAILREGGSPRLQLRTALNEIIDYGALWPPERYMMLFLSSAEAAANP